MRIEIIRDDKDYYIEHLWNALYPLIDKTDGKIMVWMTSDGGKSGNERAMVLDIAELENGEVCLK